jgi:hypothetical protein
MTKRFSLLIFVLFAIAACDSNPYSGGGEKIAPGETKPGGGDDHQAKAYMLDVPVSVNCTEGYTCTFNVRASVEGEGSVITFENLPTEAYYDARTGTVSWTPPIVSTGGGISNVHVVLVNLRGESDTVTGLQKTVVFIVNGRP